MLFRNPLISVGLSLLRHGETEQAAAYFETLLSVSPDHPQLHFLLGRIRLTQERIEDATAHFARALELAPRLAVASNALGSIHIQLGNHETAARYIEAALAVQPTLAAAHTNLGILYAYQGCLEEAERCFEHAVAIRPENASAHLHLGRVLVNKQQFESAIFHFERVLALKPKWSAALADLTSVLQMTCDWSQLAERRATVYALTTVALTEGRRLQETPFDNMTRCMDPVRQLAVAQAWSRHAHRRVALMNTAFCVGATRRRNKERLRIGYLSRDFRESSIGHLICSVLANHDRAEVEVFAYSYGQNDASHCRLTAEYGSDHFVDVRTMSELETARRIHEHQVDVLIDLTCHNRGGRVGVCALRPAPIQVGYIGCSGTSGGTFVDYMIGDKRVVPADQTMYYTEKLVWLPSAYATDDACQPEPTRPFTRADVGLPDERVVFCSFNAGYRIESVMFKCWMRLLKETKDTVLWLCPGNRAAEKHLAREAESCGIKPERLVFADRVSYADNLARLRLADLGLDTRVYNGRVTTSNALWAGVPVITLEGAHYASRMGTSILHSVGLSELVTRSLREYEVLAEELVRNPTRLAEIRRRLWDKRVQAPLFDPAGLARNLERAYREMWGAFVAGNSPKAINVATAREGESGPGVWTSE